eukprot:scaffold10956_cov115-Skeletonema_marinoi.AAC.1
MDVIPIAMHGAQRPSALNFECMVMIPNAMYGCAEVVAKVYLLLSSNQGACGRVKFAAASIPTQISLITDVAAAFCIFC